MNVQRRKNFFGNSFLQQLKTSEKRFRLNLRYAVRKGRHATKRAMKILTFGQSVLRLNNHTWHTIRIPNLRSISRMNRQVSGKTIRRQNWTTNSRGGVHCAGVVANVHSAKSQNHRALSESSFIRQVDNVTRVNLWRNCLDNFSGN